MTSAASPACSVRWVERIRDIDPAAWNALAVPAATPFLEWEWLNLLETSGSIVPANGWQPMHLTLWSGSHLAGAAPVYIKTTQSGEFVPDEPWADVAKMLHIDYYPKLVGASPVTPLTGYRFLTAFRDEQEALTSRMLAELDTLMQNRGFSGMHLLFTDPDWDSRAEAAGYCRWMHPAFLWQNRGYRDFEDFLAVFNTNQRRNIRRERKKIAQSGIHVRRFTAMDISDEHLARMFDFYAHTNDKFGPYGCKYLTPDFFHGLKQAFGRRLLIFAAFEHARARDPMAMALFVFKAGRLYGRYWGSRIHQDFLHFEICYYAPIEWAIQNDLRFFDPGIGGWHKLRRGFEVVPCQSLHKFRDPRLQFVMKKHMDDINAWEAGQIKRLNARMPLAGRKTVWRQHSEEI